jgi:hypothetical protein
VAVVALLACRKRWVTDEEVMHAVSAVEQRIREVDHARREAPDERISVRTLERDENDVEHERR